MSLDALLDAVERRGREEAERVEEEARARAKAVERGAAERLRGRRDATLRDREAGLRAEADGALASARREARLRTLTARAALLDRVFRSVESALPEVARSPRYLAALPGLLAGALECVPDGEVTIECSPGLEANVEAALREADEPATGRRVEVRPDPAVDSGLRVAGGSVTVDLTLAGRLERGRARLAITALDAERSESGGDR